MRRGLVALLREKGEQEIADDRADVEANRPDEGEFGVDDARVLGVAMIEPVCKSPWIRACALVMN